MFDRNFHRLTESSVTPIEGGPDTICTQVTFPSWLTNIANATAVSMWSMVEESFKILRSRTESPKELTSRLGAPSILTIVVELLLL